MPIQETQIPCLDQEDALEEEMATHSSILFFFSLQYSFLGNPMDREAWRATVRGVSESHTA